jgi:hypothetical protein
MTTPQSQLYALSNRIYDLYNLFQPKGDDEDSIFETIKQIDLQMQDIMCAQQRQENLMNLIVKLLSEAK